MEDAKKKEIELHKRISKGYSNLREKNKLSVYYNKIWSKKMFSLFEIRQHHKILDYGCGTCSFYPYVNDKLNSDYYGVDISFDMLSQGLKKHKGIKLLCGDGENVPLKDESFDVVIGRGILHHLPNPDEGISEVARVLKKGGYVLICDTTKNIMAELPRMLSKKTGHFSEVHKSFRKKELYELFKKNNLKIIRKKPWGFIAYPFAFPDIIEFRWMPFLVFEILVKLDNAISILPFINHFSWQEIILAKKEEKN